MEVNIIIIFLIFITSSNFTEKTFAEKNGPCVDFYEYACRNYTSKLEDEMENEFQSRLLNLFFPADPSDVIHKTFFEKSELFRNMVNYSQSCRNEQYNLTKYLNEIGTHNMTNDIKIWSLLGEIQSYGWNGVISHDRLRSYTATLTVNDTLFLPDRNELMELLKDQGVEDIETKIQNLYDLQKQWKEQSDKFMNSTERLKRKSLRFRNLTNYLQEYLRPVEGIRLENFTLFAFRNPKYFEFLEERTKVSTPEELQLMTLYLNTNFLYYLKPTTPKIFTDQQCIIDVGNKFAHGVILMYFLRYLLDISNNLENCDSLFKKTKNTTINFIQESELNLSKEQIRYVIDEIDKVNFGFENASDSFNHIYSYYRSLPLFSDTNYYKNQLNLVKHKYQFQSELYESVDFSWDTHIYMPYYNHETKAIIFPLKSLQLPLFDKQQNLLQKLSLMGFLLARALTGVLYNKNLTNVHNEIAESILPHSNITNIIKCIKDMETPENLSDDLMADFLAVRIAYRNFEEHYAKQHMNGKRRFFKNMAKLFCGQNEEGHNKNTHKIRLLAIVKHFEPFAKAFNCSEGSPMNPVKKCKL